MTAPLRGVKPAVSYNLPQAALAVGCGETTIREAIKSGDLKPHYLGDRPLFLATDLTEWVAALPTERVA